MSESEHKWTVENPQTGAHVMREFRKQQGQEIVERAPCGNCGDNQNIAQVKASVGLQEQSLREGLS